MVDDPEMLDLVKMEMRDLLGVINLMRTTHRLSRGSALGALNGVPEWEDKIMGNDGCCDTGLNYQNVQLTTILNARLKTCSLFTVVVQLLPVVLKQV